ncbi:MAG: aminotransferase class I/II-fold pyridoxal phosphate-dependent enzyme [Litoreibacter sp.]|nr:aminotransferase class I/II-fold pyridoxal phosphate-dependent enzyme [Litoreibacter sp.]
MRLSQRISNITGGGSDGWDVFYRARDMIEAGTPVIELTIGEHDIGTDPSVLEAMHKSATGGHTGYAVVPGEMALRKAVARRVEARTGVPTTADNVLITPGGQSALFTAHHAACDGGDTALYCDPYYATYPGTIRAVGANPKPIVTRPEDNFQPTAGQIGAEAEGARSLLINSPNNPTGVVYGPETMAAISNACISHGLWLISDEVYDTQVWEGDHISPRALPGMADRTLVVGSMSKSHAMTGSRVGWLVGPKEVIAAAIDLATHMTYGVPGYIQDAALFALNAGQDLETKISAPFQRRRLLAEQVLEGQNVVRPIRSSGAMYLMLDIRATGLSGEEFATCLLERHHIAVMPGESFGRAASGHIRVAMTVEDSVFEDALKKLVELAREFAA